MNKQTKIRLIKGVLHVDLVVALVVLVAAGLHFYGVYRSGTSDHALFALHRWTALSAIEYVFTDAFPHVGQAILSDGTLILDVVLFWMIAMIWSWSAIRNSTGRIRLRRIHLVAWLPLLMLYTCAATFASYDAGGLANGFAVFLAPFLAAVLLATVLNLLRERESLPAMIPAIWTVPPILISLCILGAVEMDFGKFPDGLYTVTAAIWGGAAFAWFINHIIIRRFVNGIPCCFYQAIIVAVLLAPSFYIGLSAEHITLWTLPLSVFSYRQEFFLQFHRTGYVLLACAIPGLTFSFLYSFVALIYLDRKRAQQNQIDEACSPKGKMEDLDAILEMHPELMAAEDGWSPLHTAVQQQEVERIRVMLVNGADPNAPSDNGSTPMHYACWLMNKEIVKLLLEAHGDIHQANNRGKTPIDFAEDEEFISWLKEQ